MRIDPGNKIFIAIFSVIVVGVIGFLIASIFIDFGGDVEVKKIEFQRSNFSIVVTQLKKDKKYVVQLFNGEQWLQNVNLGTNFGDRALQVTEIKDGWTIWTNSDNEISFVVENDNEKFASIYVKRKFTVKEGIVTDCLDFEKDTNWYGGPEQKDQRYPIQKFNFFDYAYITKELDSAAIMERYWLSSNGFFILLDYEAPLFIDQDESERICFTGKKSLPYDIHSEGFTFNYRIGAGVDARETHLNVINKFLGKPLGLPYERLIRFPIWNTWVRYRREINQEIIANFAEEIQVHGFNYSLLDIDDFWEDCYGSLSVNQTTFGGLKALTTNLKEKNFLVGMWVHPFLNKNCEPYFSFARDNKLLVASHSGSIETSWWNSGQNEATHIDFTKPEARSWFRTRLEAIQATYGIDIFKFDAGETSWFPEDPVLVGDPNLTPSQITHAFVELASDFGDKLEIRTGWGTQRLSVLVRMLDFDSKWDAGNGLKSLIPTLIQFNMNGYVFVLPDMIGGNQYGSDVITPELFIRWLQASVFMPALQFSVAPWQFDAETIELSLKFTKLHSDYSDLILERFRLAVSDGHPVNPPIWWLDPTDKIAQEIDDEYLLGDTILVAPVIEEGKTSRDIYFPAGTWIDGNTGVSYESGWQVNYPAPLNVLPFFIRQTE